MLSAEQGPNRTGQAQRFGSRRLISGISELASLPEQADGSVSSPEFDSCSHGLIISRSEPTTATEKCTKRSISHKYINRNKISHRLAGSTLTG